MYLNGERRPPFGRFIPALAANGRFVPAWLYGAAQEILAHLWSAFGVDHDTNTGAHRLTNAARVYARIYCDAGTYSYLHNEGFTASVNKISTGLLQLTFSSPVDMYSMEFASGQAVHSGAPSSMEDVARTWAYQIDDNTIRVLIKNPELTPGPLWDYVDASIWIMGFQTKAQGES